MFIRWLFSEAVSLSPSTSTVLVRLLGRVRRIAMATTMMIIMSKAPQLSPMIAENVACEWVGIKCLSSSFTFSGSSVFVLATNFTAAFLRAFLRAVIDRLEQIR